MRKRERKLRGQKGTKEVNGRNLPAMHGSVRRMSASVWPGSGNGPEHPSWVLHFRLGVTRLALPKKKIHVQVSSLNNFCGWLVVVGVQGSEQRPPCP